MAMTHESTQAEASSIPPDWCSRPIGSFATVSSGGTPSRKRPEFWGGVIPWITTTQISFGVIHSANEFITQVGLENSAAQIYPSGTLLLAMYGQGKTRGKVAVTNLAAAINQACAAIVPDRSVNTRFLFYSLASRYREIRDISNAGSQENLNSSLIRSISISIPPTIAEQETIAEALSDADALIESLEQLIAKRRQIKQGAMQDLLTGKRRLPGFEGQWKTRLLGSLAFIKTGSRNNQDKVADGDYPFFVRSATVERINTYSYDCEAILVPGEGGIGSIFHYIDGRFEVHQRVYAIRDFSPDAYGRYVYFYMSHAFGAHAMENSVKATVDSLRLPTFQNFELDLPPTVAEQKAIAGILADMDTDMDVLDAKLEKTRMIKQGMMHNLLTGKIRLV